MTPTLIGTSLTDINETPQSYSQSADLRQTAFLPGEGGTISTPTSHEAPYREIRCGRPRYYFQGYANKTSWGVRVLVAVHLTEETFIKNYLALKKKKKTVSRRGPPDTTVKC